MNIKFNKIIVNNFMSFGYSELQLNNFGVAIVSGLNHCTLDNAASNGSGKSTIFNAIFYALTGETAQGLKDNIENINADPDNCWVELHLDVDDDSFVIKRIKTPRTDLKLFINGLDKSGKGVKESSKLLQSYLPDLTPLLIGSVIIFGQGLPTRFTYGHPGWRKERLEKLTKSDYLIQSIRDKLDSRQAELKVLLRESEDNLLSDNTKLSLYIKQIEQLNSQLKDIDEYNTEYSLDSRLEYLGNKLNNLNNDLESYTSNLKVINDVYNKLHDKEIALLETKESERLSKLSEVEFKLNNIKQAVSDKSTEVRLLKQNIAKLKSISDICPTCGQKLPGVSKVDTSKNEIDLQLKESALSELKNELTMITTNYKDTNDDFENEFNLKLNSARELLDLQKESIASNENIVNDIKSKINRTNIEINKVSMMKHNRDSIVNSITSTNLLIDDFTKLVAAHELKIVNIKSRLDVIQKLITLTKKEFRGVLLEEVIKCLNATAKKYSKEVFNTELLSVELNENSIDIKYNNKYYESLSGGEKQKVDIILQLAIRNILSTRYKIHSNILVLDEVFDNLDSTGCHNILNLISKITGIESVFIISHHTSDLQISYDSEIVVNKSDAGISSISIR